MKQIETIFFILISTILFGQTEDRLDTIIQLGDDWKFEQAIELLNQEINLTPENPELYYWLGRYSHYLVYDTRPFSFKSNKWSQEQVLNNFQKAVTLDPDYGDAKYFIAAEYGARSLEALKQANIEQYKKELIDAKIWGGFPMHSIEYGRNVLKSCDTNSILFVNGDAEYNIIQYVQNIEEYRKDVSVVVIALLERPYYVKLLKDGIPGIMKPVPTTMNDNLIMEMHNYKWKENIVEIPIPEHYRQDSLNRDTLTCLKWKVKPDAGNNKLRSGTAILIDIIKSNNWERPVQFTQYGEFSQTGLNDYLQANALTSRLMPFIVNGTEKEYDISNFESIMFNPENYKYYNDIKDNNQPRVSYLYGQISRRRILNYAIYSYKRNNVEKAKQSLRVITELMPQETHPYSSDISNDIDDLREKLEDEK